MKDKWKKWRSYQLTPNRNFLKDTEIEHTNENPNHSIRESIA